MTSSPLVSCILPTYNRSAFIPRAIDYYLRQDYQEKELIILDDSPAPIHQLIPEDPSIRYIHLDERLTLGAKLNKGCEYARGNLIANWDDDDWYAPHRLSYQVKAIRETGASVCGINKLYYFDLIRRKSFLYSYPDHLKVWLSGSSLCFTKEINKKHPFEDITVGVDGKFIWSLPSDCLHVLEDPTFSVHLIHQQNVSPKKTETQWWKPIPAKKLQQITGKDWKTFSTLPANDTQPKARRAKKQPKIIKAAVDQPKARGWNVFACLVHEKEDCILDMIHNLQFFDPSSIILLYNGGQNPQLFKDQPEFEKPGVVVHPHPSPQKHGYLHQFAIDCMEYALENFAFESFTIVDSDQLMLRPGYTGYIQGFFKKNKQLGLLSSNPKPFTPRDKENHISLQAFKEWDLWEPLLNKIPGNKDKFVHWTFWPSTVFTRNAIEDIIHEIRENESLRNLIAKTRVWATEEVLFPTLIRSLGYEIAQNPCSHKFVKYKTAFSLTQLTQAIKQENAYWMHPVPRVYQHKLRRRIRNENDGYGFSKTRKQIDKPQPFSFIQLLNQVSKIKGWLDPYEADLLITAVHKSCIELAPPHALVEIGSYHGKATVLIGSIAKAFYSGQARVYAIDPHKGELGAKGGNVMKVAPYLKSFQKNIGAAGLAEVVTLIEDYSFNISWETPISFLLVDGLHDYESVRRDFHHFSEHLKNGAYIAFHDYADYFPDVIRFVDELLQTEHYKPMGLVKSMIVIQKVLPKPERTV
jgi:hypothetical protein